ncbi:hypothetical protein [Bradyrhizobium sp.]|jgi:hypothetical protein|uniref:hypothetical protein n=1 Tax=Bradyrhizobium sp. TaxID=376 RepID=UPI002C1F9505|nr:hypothetical protein [Bradyrhizobium sp.]HWX57121.1 hypothetical protein [Bradyrhizobium sp.]
MPRLDGRGISSKPQTSANPPSTVTRFRLRAPSSSLKIRNVSPGPGDGKRNARKAEMISALIGVLIIIVVGAICFWAIDKFAPDRRLAQLLKLLVVLICLAAILQRVLPLAGIYI